MDIDVVTSVVSFGRVFLLLSALMLHAGCAFAPVDLNHSFELPQANEAFAPPRVAVAEIEMSEPVYEVAWQRMPAKDALQAFYLLTDSHGDLPETSGHVSVMHSRISQAQLVEQLQDQLNLYAEIDPRGHWSWRVDLPFWQSHVLEVPMITQASKSLVSMPMNIAEQNPSAGHSTEIRGDFSTFDVRSLQELFEKLPREADEQVIFLPALGLVKVFAKPKSQRMFRTLVEQINRVVKKQVLVEASIVEVELNQAHALGLDWSHLGRQLSLSSEGFRSAVAGSGLFNASFKSVSSQGVFDLGLRALESYGRVKVVSKPQLSVMNHQPSLLRVVENLVYFTLDSQTSQNQTSTTTQFNTQLHSLPVGFVLFLTPHIQPSGEVILALRPSLSMATQSVLDPHPELAKQGIESRVPVIAQREVSTLMRLRPGEVGLLGGLMDETFGQAQRNLPGMEWALGFQERKKTRRELVIFIRLVEVG
jgi:general secretion pathway protein D